jgi:chemotaxis protein MotB
MALARARRGGESGLNYWPGFVDALSTLILGIIFLLTVFVVVQFYLQQEVQTKNNALNQLSSQLAELNNLLSMEKATKADLAQQLAQVRASLAASETARTEAQNRAAALGIEVEGQKKLSSEALNQVEALNLQIAALRKQLSAIEASLEASEKKDKESQAKIADLGSRLNVALAQRVQELNKFRSEFFGRLREILGNRPDVRIVGDRFVLQSEVFFDTGKADLLPAGRTELDKVADALAQLEKQIPNEIQWVLRVDGHTDVRPISGANFKSNWDLSAARAISVVQFLIGKGVSPQHLVAAGFGEFQPIDAGRTEDAYKRNRRIEFKLTER